MLSWALQNMFAQPRNTTWMTQCKCNCILCYVSIICRKWPQNCSSQSVDVILNQHAQEVQGVSWLTVLHGSFKLLVGWMTIDGFVIGLSDLVHTNVFAYTIVFTCGYWSCIQIFIILLMLLTLTCSHVLLTSLILNPTSLQHTLNYIYNMFTFVFIYAHINISWLMDGSIFSDI